MLMHPEIQRKAHAEMDRVLGGDRMPEFADQDYMPYLTAIYKEVCVMPAEMRYSEVLLRVSGSALPSSSSTWYVDRQCATRFLS